MIQPNQIISDFEILINEKLIIGILLFGSKVNGSGQGRDTDICLVAGSSNKQTIQRVLSKALQSVGDIYDLWIFEELAIFMQDEVLTNHKVIWSNDEPAMYEYLYPYRKLIADYHYRLKIAYDEI